MIFRLTHKLSAKIKAGTLATLPSDENPLADWSAALFVAGRTQCILLSNTKSLYSMVLYGKGITDDSQFIDRGLSSIREIMEGRGRTGICLPPIHRACQWNGSVRQGAGSGCHGVDERTDQRGNVLVGGGRPVAA